MSVQLGVLVWVSFPAGKDEGAGVTFRDHHPRQPGLHRWLCTCLLYRLIPGGWLLPKLLVVDDDERNRALLRACLEDASTRILEADSGEAALDLCASAQPDLVLLDVMMPGIDGFETARRIKQAAGETFLPVVLITALSDQESLLRGLQSGADELLTKPINTHELVLRVRNLLALRTKEMTLRSRNLNMLELMRFRDEMSALLVHDLKGPTAVVELSLDYLRELTTRDHNAAEALSDALSATHRISRIVGNMLDLVRLESERLVLQTQTTRPGRLLSEVAGVRAPLARRRTVQIQLQVDDGLEVDADVDLLTRVIENVLDNSLRHVPEGGHILLQAAARDERALLLIGNDGPPVEPDMRQAIFEKWHQGGGNGKQGNLGLGLYFCRLAMEAHGGRIWVGDQPLPAVFGLEIPFKRPTVAARSLGGSGRFRSKATGN
jgi:two-component system sensor histidine kinase/response regulator